MSIGFVNPQLSLNTQVFIRIVYGMLLLGTLLMTIAHRRRFFMSERWGGYAKSSRFTDIVQNPSIYPFIMVVWGVSALLIIAGWWTIWALVINLLLCRYFFVQTRWKSLLRGMGAPGFMTYWLGMAVLLLEYTSRFALDVRPLALLVLQVDFAMIMLSAGIYKFMAGYPQNHGMELGLVNPQWGYWWKFYSKLTPAHILFKSLNQLAWSTEILAAILLLIPQTKLLGAFLIIVSFLFIATQIRLGLLCEMVVLCGVLYFDPNSLGERLIALLLPASASSPSPSGIGIDSVNILLELSLWLYLVFMPIAHAGLFYNFYARKSLPQTLQRGLEIYTNFFGIIIWRVFSVDVVNFYMLIYTQNKGTGERTLVSRYGWTGGLRYGHVGESITVTSIFTTLKYYPSNYDLFRERLLRYARTVPCPRDAKLVFEYVSIQKSGTRFEFIPVAEYVVDSTCDGVEERILSDVASVRGPHVSSPVHEGAWPGTYKPLKA